MENDQKVHQKIDRSSVTSKFFQQQDNNAKENKESDEFQKSKRNLEYCSKINKQSQAINQNQIKFLKKSLLQVQSSLSSLKIPQIRINQILQLCQILKQREKFKNQVYEVIQLLSIMISLEIDYNGYSSIGQILSGQKIVIDLLWIWKEMKQKQNLHISRLIQYFIVSQFTNERKTSGLSAFIDQNITKLKELKYIKSQIRQAIDLSYILAQYIEINWIKIEIKLHLQNLIFAFLEQVLIVDEQFQLNALRVLSVIFKTQQERLWVSFSIYKNIFITLLKLAVDGCLQAKRESWKIIALLTSNQCEKIKRLFYNTSFFQILHKAKENLTQSDQISDQIRQKIVLSIANFVDYGDQTKKYALKPQILHILINSILQKRSSVLFFSYQIQKLKINAYFALLNLIDTSDINILYFIINKTPIPDLLVNGLISCAEDEKMAYDVKLCL